MRLGMLIAIVDSPDASAGANVEDVVDLGTGEIGRGKTELVIEGYDEEIVLQVCQGGEN